VDIIKRSRGTEIDIESIPLDDDKTFEMLSRGDSIGVFQLESDGMRDALRRVRPTGFNDIVALVSLYRPGAMRFIDDYAQGKRDPSSVRYADPRLRPITESTYGCCIYQEQLMEIAKQMAGFTPAEADDLRKAVGKKKRDLMAQMKDKFLAGMKESDTDRRVAQDLWSLMTAAADYSFNRSHAACYALIAYRTAYLKANYPAEYMAALISSVMNTKDKVPFYVAACEEMGIEVLPPDVNVSALDFAVVESKIRFGLNAVKNVGETAVRAIVAARDESGPFESLWDFCDRVDPQVVNKRALESLVKCGALDSTGAPRRGMLEVLEQALAWGSRQHSDRLLGQGSIFDLGLAGEPEIEQVRHHPPIPSLEFDKQELLALEKESLGLWVSEHPLQGLKEALKRKVDISISELSARRDGDIVTVGGIVGAIRSITTRRGDPMAFVRLDDLSGTVEAIVFNSAYAAARELLEADRVLLVKGRVDHKDGETKLVALEVHAFEAAPERKEVRLRVDARRAHAGVVRELAGVVRDFPGEAPVILDLETTHGARVLRFGPDLPGQARPGLLRRGEGAAGRGRGRLGRTIPFVCRSERSYLWVSPCSPASPGRQATPSHRSSWGPASRSKPGRARSEGRTASSASRPRRPPEPSRAPRRVSSACAEASVRRARPCGRTRPTLSAGGSTSWVRAPRSSCAFGWRSRAIPRAAPSVPEAY
jgi:DNA polymerase-3 subunit alpha